MSTVLEISNELNESLAQSDAVAESPTPEPLLPGVHENIPAEHYFALPYFSNSRGSLLLRSPAHLLADIQHPRGSTDAQKLGTAIHAAILEPDVFASRYANAERCTATLKSGARKGEQCGNTGNARHGGAWFCGQHAQDGTPDDVLSCDMDACLGVRDAVYAHPKLSKLLEADGRTELTVIWDDEETGVRCKARVDRLVLPYGGIVVDLKKTTDARRSAFEKKVFEYGYFRQLGFYQDGVTAHGLPMQHLVFAALEAERPYAVAGYRLTDIAADTGRDETRKLLRLYARCMERNEWPAYPVDIEEISLPTWAWDHLEVS